MKVHIRKRLNSNGDRYNLALEIYRGYVKNNDGSTRANRTTTKLDYYLYANPKTPTQKTHNKEVEQKVDIIRAEKEKDQLNGKHGFQNTSKIKASFTEYFNKLTNDRLASLGNYGNWDSALKHLIKFKGQNVSFENIDMEYCEGFKNYLTNVAKRTDGYPLSDSSVNSYFCKFRASLNHAVDDGIILVNPAIKVSTPKVKDKIREFLTQEEVKSLFRTEFRYGLLKRAFLFSCLTGMRWGDIVKLEWSELNKEGDTWKVVFHQQKTKGLQYHYINDQAKKLMGEKKEGINLIFDGLTKSTYSNVALVQWCLKAGISKHITFHCGRHTFATLQLTLGTDLYTVSKLLGHSNISTTQIYAKVIDQKKIDAAKVIPNFDIE